MGNLASCCLGEPCKAKLIDLAGNLRHVDAPVAAAELMLEYPGYVVCPAPHLLKSSLFSAIRADEELLPGQLYVLVSPDRLRSKASESEMVILEFASQKRRNKTTVKRRSSKVLPESSTEIESISSCENLEDSPSADKVGVTAYRLRQWRPALDPISE